MNIDTNLTFCENREAKYFLEKKLQHFQFLYLLAKSRLLTKNIGKNAIFWFFRIFGVNVGSRKKYFHIFFSFSETNPYIGVTPKPVFRTSFVLLSDFFLGGVSDEQWIWKKIVKKHYRSARMVF